MQQAEPLENQKRSATEQRKKPALHLKTQET
jgi:hypothetical protein